MTTTTMTRRSVAIDNLRGFAIALMILDHVLLVFRGPVTIRETITRLAMPLFFVLAGHFARRLSPRLILVGIVGIVLPTIVGFIDNPNVLFWIAIFAPVIYVARKHEGYLFSILFVALTVMANYKIGEFVGSYQPVALLGLMALGAIVKRETLEILGRILPAFLQFPGRFPLSIYVIHLLILETFR